MLLCFACLAFEQRGRAQPNTSQSETSRTDGAQRISTVRTVPPDQAVEVEGIVRLDAEVSGVDGKDSALNRNDFTLLDNGRPQTIVAFRAPADQVPLKVVLLIDTLGLPVNLVAFERKGVAGFLRQNAGHLSVPVTIYSLEDAGFSLVAPSSQDGNALAGDLDSHREFNWLFGPPHALAGSGLPPVDPEYAINPLLTAVRAVGTIAATENDVPGKKLLFWVGPGRLEPCNSYDDSGQCASRFGAPLCSSRVGTGQYPSDLSTGGCPVRVENSGFLRGLL